MASDLTRHTTSANDAPGGSPPATRASRDYVGFAASPLAALREGRLTRRFTQLFLGLMAYGVSLALVIESGLGVAPWDVLHQGLADRTPLSIGTIVIIVSFVVLLAWIPLRQWPGIGTVSNAIVIGLAADLGLWLLSTPTSWWVRTGFLVLGVVINSAATAAYIGARFGPGPRDGLMTGLVLRTGGSVRLIRTAIEVAVVALGWSLGGTVGLGTVVYALGTGPLTQLFLPWLAVRPPAAKESKTTLGSHE
ncbi:MAG TPA: hypothetical protein VI076_06990 [Actinopolymorphaceae bacterium]